MRVPTRELGAGVGVAGAAGGEAVFGRHLRQRIRRRPHIVCAVAGRAIRDVGEAEVRDLAVIGQPVARDEVVVAVAALADHRELPLRARRLLDRVRGMAVGTHRRGDVARLQQRAVFALVENDLLALMAAPAGRRDVRARHAARLLRLGADVVGAVAVGALGCHRLARALFVQQPAVDAVVIQPRDVAAGNVRLSDRRFVTVAGCAGLLEVRVIRARRGVLRAQDVVRAVAVGAARGERPAVGARLAVRRAGVVLDRLLVAARAHRRLQLLGVRQLVGRHVGVAVGAL